MNFTVWLLKRLKRKLTVTAPFRFIEGYRRFIQEEFIGAMVITLLLGVAQFIFGAIICAWIWESKPPMYMFYILLANPVIFFVYNWLVSLYDIYDTERMATWHRLKE